MLNAPLIEQAIVNLLDNAINYSKPDSTVWLQAECKDNTLEICVRDEGIGIPPQDLPHVDTWLYRGDNVANLNTMPAGLGIGLHTTRRIIEAHHGRLWAENRPGQGAVFCITLDRVVCRDARTNFSHPSECGFKAPFA